ESVFTEKLSRGGEREQQRRFAGPVVARDQVQPEGQLNRSRAKKLAFAPPYRAPQAPQRSIRHA
ncbi:MAG TPA: hypothetical protein VEW26_09500, partial [Allosphingosinicella sp.]|nr:hypothetical protein [Allosphingosinicella sp.]